MRESDIYIYRERERERNEREREMRERERDERERLWDAVVSLQWASLKKITADSYNSISFT